MLGTALISKYLRGFSIGQLASSEKCSCTKIRNFLLKNNVKLRGRGASLKKINLSEREKQIIYGTLLGDSCIVRTRKTFWMTIAHGGKQEEYARWKMEGLQSLKPRFYKYNRPDKRTNKSYVQIQIHTRSHPLFNKIQNEIYSNGNKQPTVDYLNRLSPLAIAVWYCDDGNLYQNRDSNHLTLAIDAFKDKQMIVDFFKTKYNLNFHPNRTNIRLVNKKEINKFFSVFGKHIPSCMKYKKDFIGSKKRDYSNVSGENHYRAKLNEQQVKMIREKYIPYKYSTLRLAKEYGVVNSTIGCIIHNRSWKHI